MFGKKSRMLTSAIVLLTVAVTAIAHAATGDQQAPLQCQSGTHEESGQCVSDTASCKPDIKSTGQKMWTNGSW